MSRRWAPVVAGVAVCLLLGGAVGFAGFVTDSRPVTVGAHSGRVSPTTDGWATLNLGGLLPAVRVDAGLPLSLGVRLDVTATQVEGLDQVVGSDAVIASSPEGEISKVRRTVVDMAWVHAARGAGVAVLSGLLLSLLWRGAGRSGRHHAVLLLRVALARLGRDPRQLLRPGAVAVALLAGLALVGVALPALSRDPRPPVTWRPLTALFPEAATVPGLEGVQIVDGAEVRGAATLVQGAIDTYRASLEFYASLARSVSRYAWQLHDPAGDEVVALFVTDRHDNIGMDATITAVADIGGATVLVDGGDDTSSGAPWETFSIDSLAEAAGGMDVVAVPGNHDQGSTVGARMKDRGFTVLHGEPVDVAGIRFLGDADPRSSGYTPNLENGEETIGEQADRLADVACDDGHISTVVVHDPTSGLETAQRGCAALVLSGHLHRQVGPSAVVSPDGTVATTFTGGTTGGAAYAIALGSKLRSPAQLTLVTYRGGVPVGLQPIDVDTGGTIEVQTWQPIPPPD